jgi:hypothetical protein
MNKKTELAVANMIDKAVLELAEASAKDITQLKRELDCAEDYGHEYVFVEKNEGLTMAKLIGVRDCMRSGRLNEYDPDDHASFTYKCTRCGRTVDYTWDELTVKERNALETLGRG